jgi:hypothetical protein
VAESLDGEPTTFGVVERLAPRFGPLASVSGKWLTILLVEIPASPARFVTLHEITETSSLVPVERLEGQAGVLRDEVGKPVGVGEKEGVGEKLETDVATPPLRPSPPRLVDEDAFREKLLDVPS